MTRRLGLALAGLGVAAIVAYRAVRRKRPPAADPAEELRRKLAESRDAAEQQPESERSDPAEPDERRRRIHERGRAAARKMRDASRG